MCVWCCVLPLHRGRHFLPAFQSGFLRLPSQIVPNRAPGFLQRPAEAADTDLIAQLSMAPSNPNDHFIALVISQTHYSF